MAARAEQRVEGSIEDATQSLLRELLVLAEVMEPAPSLAESPWLWLGVGLAAAAAAGITGALLYDPGTRTRRCSASPGRGKPTPWPR